MVSTVAVVLDVICANGACPSIGLDEGVLDELPERVSRRTWAPEMVWWWSCSNSLRKGVGGGDGRDRGLRQGLAEEMVAKED